ncbi:MAG: AIR synthase related protein [Myxococcota bacterium]
MQLGPELGEDACAIRVGAGALIVAADPITLTGESVGSHAVWVNANDVAVTGARPRWFLATVLMPPGTGSAEVRALFARMREALRKVGATLVGGHTEVTPAVRQAVVSGQMLGLCEDGRFVRTGDVQPGDAVLQVGPVPIEGGSVLAAAAPRLGVALPGELRSRAERALESPGISVVEAALAARELGARALHDPTEGGLAMGLHELAAASRVALELEPGRVLWFEPGTAVCERVAADPWGTLASGALLAAFPPDRAEEARSSLQARGFLASILGHARRGAGISLAGRPLPRFARDEVARVLSNEARGTQVL